MSAFPRGSMTAGDISRLLAVHIEQLVPQLFPNGYREGHEWRVGSPRGESGDSLGVHLTGAKAGIWHDFATGEGGDALTLIAAVLFLSTTVAMDWSCRWLGLADGDVTLPKPPAPVPLTPEPPSDRWRYPWKAARPIRGTLAETYLRARGLEFDDPTGRVLRFAARRARKNPADELEYRPALLALLSDLHTGEPCGLVNVYLEADGHDRLRDSKGKTTTSRAGGAVVLLSDFDEPTMGLTICEGVETGISLFMDEEMRPVWACGGAGMLTKFPVLGGIECLTIAADAGSPGQMAATEVAQRWRQAGREILVITPSVDDWAAREALS
jgi:putative DNA primase/helicase